MALFLMFYKLLLEQENMHHFKRYYLLLALVAALLIPKLVFTEYVTVSPITPTEMQVQDLSNADPIMALATLEEQIVDVTSLLWMLYFIGVLFFGTRFAIHLGRLFWRIRSNPKQKSARFVHVLLQENFPPHTFFNYIFLNQRKWEANQIPKTVLLHEQTHARQKHSWDVVFIELVQVIFWFNPFVHLFKTAIKLNHEFLADASVLKSHVDTVTYQNILLSYAVPDSQYRNQSNMAHAINYSSIKKRFTIMKKQNSKKSILLRSLLLLPLLAMLLFGFSETQLVEVQPKISESPAENATLQDVDTYNELAKKYNAISIEYRIIPLDDLRTLERIYTSMTVAQKQHAEPFPDCLPKNVQDGASRELMKEYDRLARHYNEMSRDHMKIKQSDVERLEYIYSLMSAKQKADAEPFPKFPEPPASPVAPKAPQSTKEVKPQNPPKPIEPKNLNEREEAALIIQKVIEEQDPYDINSNVAYLKPDGIPSSRVKENVPSNLNYRASESKLDSQKSKAIRQPPSPPAPPSPLDHVIEMAKKGATFYYEGDEISADKAIALVKNNTNLNIDSRGHKDKNPQVRISKSPIVIH